MSGPLPPRLRWRVPPRDQWRVPAWMRVRVPAQVHAWLPQRGAVRRPARWPHSRLVLLVLAAFVVLAACMSNVLKTPGGGLSTPIGGGGGLKGSAVVGVGINVEPSYRPWRYPGGPEPDSWWCVQPNCYQNPDPAAMITTELRLARELGVNHIRIEFPWRFLEPRQGVYDWSRADLIVQSAKREGIALQPILVYSPIWAAGSPTDAPIAQDFGAFVREIVGRYKSTIHEWEMWNEPNLGRYWSGDVQTYVRTVLVPGFIGARAADPTARVVLGGPGGVDTKWLEGIYSAGGGDSFDIMAWHDYSNADAILAGARTVLGILQSHNQGYKPLWLGEFGVQENTLRDTTAAAILVRVLTTRSPLSQVDWYNLRDDHAMRCCPPSIAVSEYYGLVQHDNATRKDGFAVLQQLLTGRAGSAPSSPTQRATTAPTAATATPPPAATRAPAGTTLLQATFEGDALGQVPAGWSAPGGTWAVVQDGSHAVRQTDLTPDRIKELATGNASWVDYSVEVAVQAPSDGGSFGVVARRQDPYNGYQLLLKQGNFWYLGKEMNGNWVTLASGGTSYIPGSWHTLRLDLQGSRITASLDGTQVASVTDTSFAAGGISLRTVSAATYDDVRVIAR